LAFQLEIKFNFVKFLKDYSLQEKIVAHMVKTELSPIRLHGVVHHNRPSTGITLPYDQNYILHYGSFILFKKIVINMCKKGKGIYVTGRVGPFGCATSRLPHFLQTIG
jgi:hypothetical protein